MDMCGRLLGKLPSANKEVNCSRVKLNWLKRTFSECPEDASFDVVECRTRAYLLYLIENFDQAGILYLLGEHLHWLVITGLLFYERFRYLGEIACMREFEEAASGISLERLSPVEREVMESVKDTFANSLTFGNLSRKNWIPPGNLSSMPYYILQYTIE
ncbi:unnamed protein product [Arabidopsis thaliana]|uniref:Uncharacterized protein n=1 Tax=Arabidopsis thaliana TaxID=3702 RepID=A0A654G6K5_ARATH|nr:unnamed protein product [Arabidopsis thaliana]